MNLRAMHGHLMAIQVRADDEGQVFGHGVLKVVDWVRSLDIVAREDFGSPPIGESGPEDEEYGVELVPSEYGVVSVMI